ncbi:MAG: hypothetical protein IPL19_01985 [Sandaracinaceae bacterium]|nr:hypothetical protein [Sandaracinaceae bacterium]MBK7772520.1 hypothetical protein [Sandaracinaceae bacterium]MBK8406732.1 hypothetical protein [Sandaracinaceae bacterium]
MRITSLFHPATLLRALCSVLSVGMYAYEMYGWFLVGLRPSHVVVLGAVCLFAVGFAPFTARHEPERAWRTAAAAGLAVPLARLRFGTLMHDLAIVYPWLDHDRWCFPSAELIVTGETAPALVFLPVVIWAGLLGWWHTRIGRRGVRGTTKVEGHNRST